MLTLGTVILLRCIRTGYILSNAIILLIFSQGLKFTLPIRLKAFNWYPKVFFNQLPKLKPNYDELRVFGFLCYPWLKTYSPHKALKSSRCAFLGYSKVHKGYLCLDLLSRQKFISHHVLFYEQVFPFQQLDDTSTRTTAHPTSIPLPPIPVFQ